MSTDKEVREYWLSETPEMIRHKMELYDIDYYDAFHDMDPQTKESWIAALLGELQHAGGPYEQGRGMLWTDDERYCCLGVLVDISGGESEWCSDDQTLLSKEGISWFHLDEESHSALAELNDGGLRFWEIAMLIRAGVYFEGSTGPITRFNKMIMNEELTREDYTGQELVDRA
jgi:hypothetical protein